MQRWRQPADNRGDSNGSSTRANLSTAPQATATTHLTPSSSENATTRTGAASSWAI